MSTPRVSLPFTEPFTHTDLVQAGLSHAALSGWLRRNEVIMIGRGTYAPTHLPDLPRQKLIHVNRMITDGRHPVTYEAAALLHGLCQPPRLPPRHKVPQRARDIPATSLVRVGRLLAPSRALTAFEMARWQSLPGALIPMDCVCRNGRGSPEIEELRGHLARTAGWIGTTHIAAAMRLATAASGSALESYSRGLIIDEGLPIPELQTAFTINGYRYYVDFFWRELGIIGEADGEMKFDEHGRAQFAQHRRQARLQSLGLTVVRWGWPDIYPDARAWLEGMRRILR